VTALTPLTAPVRVEDDANLRPVPWRRMAWVTWRQHRVGLTGVAALVGALAVCLWIFGLQLHHAHVAAISCRPASSVACSDLISRFNDMNKVLVGGYVLQAVPALIGAFVGAPVLARELEMGTFRYAWTQGFGRWRWTLAKLVALAVVVTAVAGVISVLISWYYQPYLATANQTRSLTESSPFASGLFDLRGVGFAAWALTAFAIGGLVGTLIRRVVPAIVATLVAYTGLALVAGNFLRQHYLTPLTTSKLNIPASAWITRQWGTKGGVFAFAGRPPISLLEQFCPPAAVGPGKPSSGTFAQCMSQHGYTLWTSYQPANRFWQFQWIEGGWLFGLSALLIAATVWVVRR
jgi:hypothetical protein